MYLKENELSFYLIPLEHEEVESVSLLFSKSAEDAQVPNFRKEVSTDCPESTIGWLIFSIFLISVFSSWLNRWQLHVGCSLWLIDSRHSSPTQLLTHQQDRGKNQRSKSEIPWHTQYFLFGVHTLYHYLHEVLKGGKKKSSQNYQDRRPVCDSLWGTNILPINAPLIVQAMGTANIMLLCIASLGQSFRAQGQQ